MTHQVRIHVVFTHPETGSEHQANKEFAFAEFRRSAAKRLAHRFPPGAEMPMLVRGRPAGFDVAARPQWVDIW